ncbi:hypothetical protein BOX17_03705 [Halomonas aestuarii]|uniref:Uncharacterized protein n=1 Tax=Halomonas aestuarii TaxID=1897729 RepID=A0A1J0VDN9_9GAMM|nr:hypothetical protein [Halomonas aestuarii]APE30134.1 hypothetical protein BOX17_03705 [Halomonas aestuarii]
MASKLDITDLQRSLGTCQGAFSLVGFFRLFVNLLMQVHAIYTTKPITDMLARAIREQCKTAFGKVPDQ